MYRIHLMEEQREELARRVRLRDTLPRTRERLDMVRLSDAGWSVPRIARHVLRTEPTARYWIKRFLAGGFAVLEDLPHLGQSSAITPEMLAALKQELEQGQRTCTARQAVEWLTEQYGIRITPEWMAVLLTRAGLSYKRTQRRLKHKQDPDEVVRKRQELAEAEKGAPPAG